MKCAHRLLPAFTAVLSLVAQAPSSSTGTAIRAVLTMQTNAWNGGDLNTFVQSYAADCVFVGSTLVRGRDQVLARYRSKYPDKARMGRLAFSNLEVKQIDTHSATVLGNFHLDRRAESGGPADGVFSLVLQERAGHWLIILDHTS